MGPSAALLVALCLSWMLRFPSGLDAPVNRGNAVQSLPPPPPALAPATVEPVRLARPRSGWAWRARAVVFAEAAFFLLTGIPLLLAMLVLLPVTQSGGVPAGFGVALGVGITTVGVGLVFAARSLGRGSPGARRVVIAVQVVLLVFALASVPFHLVDVWPVWLAVVFAASLVLYALLFHRLPAAVPQFDEDASPVAKRSAWATIGQVIGVSAAIVVILVLAAMALLTAVLVIVLSWLAKGG